MFALKLVPLRMITDGYGSEKGLRKNLSRARLVYEEGSTIAKSEVRSPAQRSVGVPNGVYEMMIT